MTLFNLDTTPAPVIAWEYLGDTQIEVEDVVVFGPSDLHFAKITLSTDQTVPA